MSIEETNAFSALNQLIIPNNMSPSKYTNPPMDEQMLKLLQGLPIFNNQPIGEQTSQQMIVQTEHPSSGEEQEKASPSNDSESPRQTVSPDGIDGYNTVPSVNIHLSKSGNGTSRNDGWFECFTTTSKAEYMALVYSLYVIDKNERKVDGWEYFECLNRLQNKCRFKVRCKKQDEFYIIEEKGGHNHGIEPVGQAGSHAGLPKTLREIVDKAFNESWAQEVRTAKIDEEIRRLGLPPNPRLSRQIDNRVAYLRRVKNLNESKKIQEQVSSNTVDPNNLFNAQLLQMLMEQNGGSLVVEKGVVDQLLGEPTQMTNGSDGTVENNDGIEMKEENVGNGVQEQEVETAIQEETDAGRVLSELMKQNPEFVFNPMWKMGQEANQNSI